MNGGFGQCILCGDCIDICKIRMDLEGLPPPLRWNTDPDIIPLLPLEQASVRQA
jgi:polyferredoxin